jgi:DNA-directed RNA polymerase subunit N (RpoN/RPB10)
MPRKVFEVDPGYWSVGSFSGGELIGGCHKRYKKRANAEKELKRLNEKYGR